MFFSEVKKPNSNKPALLDYWLKSDIKEDIKHNSNPNKIYHKLDNTKTVKSKINSNKSINKKFN